MRTKTYKGFANIFLLLIIGLIAIAAVGYLAYKNGIINLSPQFQTRLSPTSSPSKNSITLSVSKTPMDTSNEIKFGNLPNLPPETKWGNPEIVERPYITVLGDNDIKVVTITGEEWSSTEKDITTDRRNQLDSLTNSFFNDQFYKQLKWDWKVINGKYEIQAIQADGATGGIISYLQFVDGKIRLVAWSTETHFKVGEFPENPNCPCDMTLTYFVSDITPLDKLLYEFKN